MGTNSGDSHTGAFCRLLPGILSIWVNAGYLLLLLGIPSLAAVLIPNAHPLLLIAFTLLAALVLWPLRKRLIRKTMDDLNRRDPLTDPVPSGTKIQSSDVTDFPTDLDQLFRAIHSATDFDVLLELVYTQTARLLPVRSFRIALVDEHASSLQYVFYAEDGRRCGEREGVAFPMKQDLAGEVVYRGSALIVPSYTDACLARKLPLREPTGAWAGIPLPSGASIIGVMLLLREQPFDDSDRQIMESIAAHAGPAIAKARLQCESARQAQLLSTLQRVSRRLIGTLEWNRLLDVLFEGARELLPSPAAVLMLPDPAGGWIAERQIGLPEGFGKSALSGMELPLRHTAVDDRPIYLADLPPSDSFRQAMEQTGLVFQSAISLPLHQKERLLGCIVFLNPAGSMAPFGEEEPLLAAYATLAVAALENARLNAQTDHSLVALVDELASLQSLDQELNAASDTAQAMATTLEWAMRHTEASAGLVVIPSESGFIVVAAIGYPEGSKPGRGTPFPPELGGLEESIQSGKSVIRRVEESISCGLGLLPAGKSTLALSIRHGREVMGIVLLESEDADAFSPIQIQFLERLTAHAAVAISNARLYAEVQNANQAKSEFISFVAHELKTPMTSIRGYTDLLAQGAVGPVSPPQANFLATIRANTDRMASLVSDLNDISRIESGRLRLEFSGCALGEALEEVLQSLRSQIEAKEQNLTLEIPPDLPPVWVDHGRLIQILANLVSNAHKYTPANGSIRIAAERASNRWDPAGPPDIVHILVQDSGFGISPQEQKNVFQKFFRSEDRSVRDLPGTGLGLHITRNLVELQGGKIWYESELRRGTTFHFTMPVASV